MHVEFIARRNVRILGKDYAPGDVINDPNIPSRALSSMLNTRRIGQRINGEFSRDINVPAAIKTFQPPAHSQPRPPAPVPASAPAVALAASEAATAADDEKEADSAAPMAAPAPSPAASRRAFYEQERADKAPQRTLRQFLQDACQSAGLQIYGDVEALIQRLDRAPKRKEA